jgi:hypothetical protein
MVMGEILDTMTNVNPLDGYWSLFSDHDPLHTMAAPVTQRSHLTGRPIKGPRRQRVRTTQCSNERAAASTSRRS